MLPLFAIRCAAKPAFRPTCFRPDRSIWSRQPACFKRRQYSTTTAPQHPVPPTYQNVKEFLAAHPGQKPPQELIRDSLLLATETGSLAEVDNYLKMIGISWGPQVCRAVLRFAASAKHVELANQAWKVLEDEGHPINVAHYGFYLKALCDGQSRVLEAHRIVKDMQERNIVPVAETVRWALEVLSADSVTGRSLGLVPRALTDILEYFVQSQVTFNKLHLSLILKIARHLEDFALGYRYYQRYLSGGMKTVAELDVVLFNQLLSLLRHAQLSKKQKLSYLQQILLDMDRYRIPMNMLSLVGVVPILGTYGTIPMLDEVYQLATKSGQIAKEAKFFSVFLGSYASFGAMDKIKMVFADSVKAKVIDKRLLTTTALAAIDWKDFAFAQEVISLLEGVASDAASDLKRQLAQAQSFAAKS